MAGKKLRDEDLVLNIIVNGDQGQKEILDLEKAIKSTNRELRALEKERNTLIAQGKKETAEYKAVTAAINLKNSALDKARGRLAQLKQGMDLTTMSVSDLRREITRLTKLRNIAPAGSAEFAKLDAQLKLTKARFSELTGAANQTGGFFGQILPGKIGMGIAKFGAYGIAAKLLFDQIGRAIEPLAAFDDAMADVRKTTGLTQDEVVSLNDSLKTFDTRTSQEELLRLARVAGKLGVEGSNDILGFVRAADMIGVALAEDLGGDVEGAITKVGKLVDIFKIEEEFGIEQSLLKVGSAINELGANSTANEEFLVDFANRLAGIAPAAGISIPNVLGLGATLDQLGQSAEVAGTTFVNLIPKMFKDSAEYARIAGIDFKEFNHLLGTDTNEAMIRLFEGLKGNNQGMQQMVIKLQELGLDGARATNVVSALAGNTELLREQQVLANQAFDEGNSILDEASIKNETLGAQLEKIGKYFYNIYMNSDLLAGMKNFFGGIADGLYGVNTLTKAFEDQQKEVDNLDKNILPLLNRYDQLASKSTLSAEENIELKNIIAQISKEMPEVITQFDGYGNALAVSTGKAREFIEAQKLMLQYTNKEAIRETKDELIDMQTEIVKVLTQLNRKDADGDLTKLITQGYGFDQTIKEVKLTGDEISELQSKLASLRAQEKNQKLLISGLSGEVSPTDPSASPKDTLDVQSLISETPEEKAAKEKAAKEATKESERKRKQAESDAEKERERLEKEAAQQEEIRRKAIISQLDLVAQEQIAYDERLKEAGLYYLNKKNMTVEQQLALEALENQHLAKLNDITSDRIDENFQLREQNYKRDLDAIRLMHNEEYKSLDTVEKAKQFLRGKVSDDALRGIKNMRQAQVALDKYYLSEEEAITKEYLMGLLQDLQTLGSTGQLEGIDLADQVLSPEQKAELEARIAEVKLLISELGLKSSTDVESDRGKREQSVDILGMSVEDWNMFFENLENGKASFQDFMKVAQAMIGVYAQFAQYRNAQEDRDLAKYESGINKKKELMQRQLDSGLVSQETYNTQIEKLDADLDKKKAVIDRNQAKRERNVALMSAIVNTAAAVASALPNVFLSVLVGALGALQIGTILATPLPEIPGAESGGFLDVVRSQDGRMYRARREPDKRGYVHSPTVITGEDGSEFVANKEAVNNPTIKPVMDIIDTAQRQGNVQSLDLFRVLEDNRQLRSTMQGRARGGRIRSSSDARSGGVETRSGMDTTALAVIRKNTQVMSQLSQQLRTPFKANVSLTGRGSLQEKQAELAQIESSANL